MSFVQLIRSWFTFWYWL